MPEPEVGTAGDPVVLLHDGSFEGFLSAVAEGLSLAVPVESVGPWTLQPDLFERRGVRVDSDRERAAEVWRRLRRSCGADVAAACHAAHLSEIAGIGTHLWRHIGRILSGRDPSNGRDILDPSSMAVLQAAGKTRHELHRFQGFVRFNEAPDGTLYSVIAPEHDIVALLGSHFLARLPGQRWIVADSRRGTCAHCDGRTVSVSRIDRHLLPRGWRESERLSGATEDEWGRLWKAFFRVASVPERRNPRQQARLLPRKYRAYLPETGSPAVQWMQRGSG